MTQFYPLEVVAVEEQTKLAKCISFKIPSELKAQFSYKPGQFLTLRFMINGEEYRRSYSLCSSPNQDVLQVGVKRVKEGVISNHINDTVTVGSRIDVMPADGRFVADINKNHYKTYFLFAAGSGITPIFSIVKTVLNTEPHSYVHMIYGNNDQNSIMFKDELDTLLKEHGQRFLLVHCLSNAKSEWSDLWSSKNKKQFREGRVDDEAVNWFITEHPPYAQNAEYYICGPGTMIKNIKQSLLNIDVPANRIFAENFSSEQSDDSIQGVVDAELTTTLNGKVLKTTINQNQTVLRSLLEAGHEPPYSCEGGVCASCVCTLKKGKVHMKSNAALSKSDVDSGQILSCQSIPLSDEVEIEYL